MNRKPQISRARLAAAAIALALCACLMGCGKRLTMKVAVALEAEPESTFAPDDVMVKTGDQIRLFLTSGSKGYCYVFHKGTSGEYYSLFPRGESGAAPHAVQPNQPVRIPYEEDKWLRFGEGSGTEWVYVVFSPSKVDRLEELLEAAQLASADIQHAVDELKASLPLNYSLQKKVGKHDAVFQMTSKDPRAFILAEIGLQHVGRK